MSVYRTIGPLVFLRQFKRITTVYVYVKKYCSIISEFSVNRIEGNQMEDREGHKMWLVRHLEVTRQIMVDDLKVAKVMLQSHWIPH